MRLLEADKALLFIVDIQERFLPVIAEIDRVIEKTGMLIQAATRLDIPIIVTEQYPQGLGHTAPVILKQLPVSARCFEKSTFSSIGAPGVREYLVETGRTQIMVAGIETQVCINQTAHQLLNMNYSVFLMEDAVSSRNLNDRDIAIAKLRQSGAIPCSAEMALFELLRDAKNPHFKAFLEYIK